MNLFLLAIAPVFIIILYIYFKDKYEKEPKLFLFYNFSLGAIVSIIITTALYYVINFILPLTNPESVFQQFIKAFFIVGLTEELVNILLYVIMPRPIKHLTNLLMVLCMRLWYLWVLPPPKIFFMY